MIVFLPGHYRASSKVVLTLANTECEVTCLNTDPASCPSLEVVCSGFSDCTFNCDGPDCQVNSPQSTKSQRCGINTTCRTPQVSSSPQCDFSSTCECTGDAVCDPEVLSVCHDGQTADTRKVCEILKWAFRSDLKDDRMGAFWIWNAPDYCALSSTYTCVSMSCTLLCWCRSGSLVRQEGALKARAASPLPGGVKSAATDI